MWLITAKVQASTVRPQYNVTDEGQSLDKNS